MYIDNKKGNCLFAKFKDERFKDIPKDYKEWMLKSFDWHPANINLKQAIKASM